jgi:hypothetical protein
MGVKFGMGRGTARNLFRRLYRGVTSIVTRPPDAAASAAALTTTSAPSAASATFTALLVHGLERVRVDPLHGDYVCIRVVTGHGCVLAVEVSCVGILSPISCGLSSPRILLSRHLSRNPARLRPDRPCGVTENPFRLVRAVVLNFNVPELLRQLGRRSGPHETGSAKGKSDAH